MGLFDFLEQRLEEFLKENPQLELLALEEQIDEQKRNTIELIRQLEVTEKRHQEEILAVAKDIQTWHSRVAKAKTAGRLDLAQAAQEREAALLRQGNQLWGQMEAAKQQIIQAQELLIKIENKQKEIKAKKKEFQTHNPPSNSNTKGWSQGYSYQNSSQGYDDLDVKFQEWELNEELERMKRQMGK